MVARKDLRPVKTLVIIFEELVPISGGGTPRTFSIVHSLAERGHEVYVAASFAVDEEQAKRELGATGVLPLRGVSRMDPAKMRKYAVTYPVNILRVAAYAWRLGPDVILTHNTAVGFAALLGKVLRPGTTAVLDLTDLLFEYHPLGGLVIIADLVHSYCHEQARSYEALLGEVSSMGELIERLIAHSDEIEAGLRRYDPRDYGLRETLRLLAGGL